MLGAYVTGAIGAPASSLASDGNALTRRDIPQTDPSWDVSMCVFDSRLPAVQWALLVPHDRDHEMGGCGAGILDNLRGNSNCGDITSWSCGYVGDNGSNTARVRFWTTAFCQDVHVTGAVLAASAQQENIPCLNPDEAKSESDMSDRLPSLPPL